MNSEYQTPPPLQTLFHNESCGRKVERPQECWLLQLIEHDINTTSVAPPPELYNLRYCPDHTQMACGP